MTKEEILRSYRGTNIQTMPVHSFPCLCGCLIVIPTSWEFVRCPTCGSEYSKVSDDYYVVTKATENAIFVDHAYEAKSRGTKR